MELLWIDRYRERDGVRQGRRQGGRGRRREIDSGTGREREAGRETDREIEGGRRGWGRGGGGGQGWSPLFRIVDFVISHGANCELPKQIYNKVKIFPGLNMFVGDKKDEFAKHHAPGRVLWGHRVRVKVTK